MHWKLIKLPREVYLFTIELNLKLKYVYVCNKWIVVIVNHFSHFKWFFWLIITICVWILKILKNALKMIKLPLEVSLLTIELNLKLKYVYVCNKWIVVIVNHFFHFKWFFWLIITYYHYFLKKSKNALKNDKITTRSTIVNNWNESEIKICL